MHAMIEEQQLTAEAKAIGLVALLDSQAETVTPMDLFNCTSGDAWDFGAKVSRLL
jgi:hypothetical protein